MNKKQLYENIMQKVSKQVKRALNEDLAENEVYFVAYLYGKDRSDEPMYGHIKLFNNYNTARNYIQSEYSAGFEVMDWVEYKCYQIAKNGEFLPISGNRFPEYKQGAIELSVLEVN